MSLETYTGFNPNTIADYFTNRGWPVTMLSITEVGLVRVQKGAALECGDGRFDQLEQRNGRGIRILGGVNAIMALLTGGNEAGFQKAVELLIGFDAAPGTHSADDGGCGYADLWRNGELESAIYPYKLDINDKGNVKIGAQLTAKMEACGGRHYRLNGNHNEKGVRLNPFRGYTEDASDGLRFRIDDWFMADLELPYKIRLFKIAETIEKLKPDATSLEILIP